MAGHAEAYSSGVTKARATVEFLSKVRKLHVAMGGRGDLSKFIEQMRKEIETDPGLEVTPMSFADIVALAKRETPKIVEAVVELIDDGSEYLSPEDFQFLFDPPMMSAPIVVENTVDEVRGLLSGCIEAKGVRSLEKTLRGARRGSTVLLSDFNPSPLTISNADLLEKIADMVFGERDNDDRAPTRNEVMDTFDEDEKELIAENLPTMREFTTLHAALDLAFRQHCVLVIAYQHALTPVLYNRMVSLGRINV
jgi:hypothetical protein